MAKVKFTQEQIDELNLSNYVLHVTPSQVHFSNEFKMEFWELYCSGMEPRDIIINLGLDPAILGVTRIDGLKTMIRNQAKSGKGFRDLNACYKTLNAYDCPENRIRYLEHQIEYKDQEIAFLKKIVSLSREEPK
jgi:hypothetical protein